MVQPWLPVLLEIKAQAEEPMKGKLVGIYAISEVAKAPQFMDKPPDIDIWTMPIRAKARFYAPVTFQQRLLETPLLKSVLLYDRMLYEMEVIHRPRNTNFRISEAQWHQAIALIKGE